MALLTLGIAGSAYSADPVPNAGTVKVAAPIPLADFFRKPEFSSLSLSPNGKYLATLRPVDGLRKLVVIDLEKKTSTVVASSPEYDVMGMAWIGNNRLRYTVGQEEAGVGEQTGGGLFVVDKDGKNDRVITPKAKPKTGDAYSGGRPLRFFSGVPDDNSSDIIVMGWERNAKQADLYRYDTYTGKKTLLTFDAPPQAANWLLDRAGVPRVAASTIDYVTTVWYRDGAESPWRTLGKWKATERSGFSPVAFDYDNKTMYVTAYLEGKDKAALYKFDFEKNQVNPTPVFEDKDMDIQANDLIFSKKRGGLIGMNVEADKPRLTWFDKGMRDLQASIDAALPGKVNYIRNANTTQTGLMLVYSYSDKDPGSYYLYDDNKKDLQFLLQPQDWIDPEQMAEYRPIRYKARDGLEIPAYLTMPKGTTGKNLPLVVYVHGGPFVHGEQYGWHGDAQFLASRGYVVLQPEYRGSTGYGWNHFRKAWKQWGMAMQDDVTDGVNWLVSQGIVDKNRVCIAGASYGGYAVMMGLAKDPELYKCGINWVGVTDIQLMYKTTWSDFDGSDWQKYGMPEMIGDNVKDAEMLKSVSPLYNAKKINKPVLMAYGARDFRVPLVHGEEMRDALKANNVPVEWTVYKEEGHGWNKTVNKLDFWAKVEAFLEKNIGNK